jgi:hypothetical protein
MDCCNRFPKNGRRYLGHFGRKASETLGFPGKRRKRHAETAELSGRSRIKRAGWAIAALTACALLASQVQADGNDDYYYQQQQQQQQADALAAQQQQQYQDQLAAQAAENQRQADEYYYWEQEQLRQQQASNPWPG